MSQMLLAAKASKRLGLNASVTFSGALAWPFMYPWPQRPAGLVETAFEELGRRWTPILDAYEDAGCDVCYEIHPGEDIHDGATFERFVDAVGGHPRACINYDPSHFLLQQLDYVAFIDLYHERIKAFHVKDAEFNPSGRVGVYGGYESWIERAGRFRSLGDGQVDFSAIFSKLAQYDYDSWAVLEWECASSIRRTARAKAQSSSSANIIRVTEKAFDDFAAGGTDEAANRRMLGIDRISDEGATHDDCRITGPEAEPPLAPRHGRRRARRLHRRGAPHRGPSRRPLGARGGRALLRPGAGEGSPARICSSSRIASMAISTRWRAASGG